MSRGEKLANTNEYSQLATSENVRRSIFTDQHRRS